MAVDIVAEVLAQRGVLVSPEEARALMERWTATEYATVANSLQVGVWFMCTHCYL